jgi:protein-S-isoprenylcysteine O-methyltransferase Ste14
VTAPEKSIPSWKSLMSLFDIRDFLVFGGLIMLGYGLWLFKPWIGFAVTGFFLMLIGYFIRDKGEK